VVAQRRERAVEQPLRDVVVEPAADEGDPQTAAVARRLDEPYHLES
jgi:hypothetical protein